MDMRENVSVPTGVVVDVGSFDMVYQDRYRLPALHYANISMED